MSTHQQQQETAAANAQFKEGLLDILSEKKTEEKQPAAGYGATTTTGKGTEKGTTTGTGEKLEYHVGVQPKEPHPKEGKSVIEIIKIEHDEIKQLFNEYKAASAGNVKEAKAFLMLKLIVQHSGREESVLYPVLREKLGAAVADHSEADHLKVTENLYQLDSLTWAQVPHEFNRLVMVTMQDLLKHVEEEETEILPVLASEMTNEQLIELGKSYNSAVVTTRPHPSAPHEGKMSAAAHIASYPIDAARDLARWTQSMIDLAHTNVF